LTSPFSSHMFVLGQMRNMKLAKLFVVLLFACCCFCGIVVEVGAQTTDGEGFGSILKSILTSVNATEHHNVTTYDLTPEDFVTMANMTTAVEECNPGEPTAPVPTGYLTISVYENYLCYGTLGLQFSYPVGVCVSYGIFSEFINVVNAWGFMYITITSYWGSSCSGWGSSALYITCNDICRPPYVLSFETDLPPVGLGVVSQ
jgi:hypothetical protein